jgi:hypothetical protein
MPKAKKKKTGNEVFEDAVAGEEPKFKTIPIQMPSWYECVPTRLYFAAMTGSNLAVEVSMLIEYAFHQGHIAGAKGEKDETDVADVKDNGGPSAQIVCDMIDEATRLTKLRLDKERGRELA